MHVPARAAASACVTRVSSCDRIDGTGRNGARGKARRVASGAARDGRETHSARVVQSRGHPRVTGRGEEIAMREPGSSRRPTEPALLRPRTPKRVPLRQEHTILVVEDDAEMRRLLAQVLERAGYRVVAAQNGGEAIHWLGLCPFDGSLANVPALIVSDVRLPDFSGLELLEVMVSVLADVPVVLITGFPSRETYAEAFELGARRVLEKPFDLDELRNVVWSVLRERAGEPPRATGLRGPRA